MKKTKAVAKYIKDIKGWTGVVKLYAVDPPVKYEDDDFKEQETKYVAVSATIAAFSGPETYIFPTDKDGNVLNWGELPGSFQGSFNHTKALNDAGYSVEGGSN